MEKGGERVAAGKAKDLPSEEPHPQLQVGEREEREKESKTTVNPPSPPELPPTISLV